MGETPMLAIAASLVATMFGILLAVGGWVANKNYNKLEDLSKSIIKLGDTLHNRVTILDRRVTRVETHCNIRHPEDFDIGSSL